MTQIGYARVSTKNQELDRQIDKLTAYGCEKSFKEKQIGTNSEREELAKAMEYLKEEDTLVVYKID